MNDSSALPLSALAALGTPQLVLSAFAVFMFIRLRRTRSSLLVASTAGDWDFWIRVHLVLGMLWLLSSFVCLASKMMIKPDPDLPGAVVELIASVNAILVVTVIVSRRLQGWTPGLAASAWLFAAAVIAIFFLAMPFRSDAEFVVCVLRVVFLWLFAVSTGVQRTRPLPLYDPRLPETFSAPHESPLSGGSFWAIYTFSWIDPIFRLGLTKRLDAEHMYDIPVEHRAEQSRSSLLPAWSEKIQQGSKEGALVRAMYAVWWRDFWYAGLFHFCELPCIFLGPLLLNFLIKYYGDPEAPLRIGFVCTFGLMCGGFLGSFCTNHFQFNMTLLGMHAQGATGALVFEKGLRLSQPAAQVHTAGKLASIMNVDCERLGFAAYFLHFIWSMPLIFVVAMYLIWQQLGVSSLAAVAVMVSLSPLNKKIAKMYMKYGMKISEKRDRRAETFKEMNQAVKFVKLLTWEEKACGLINAKREAELQQLKGMKNTWILGQLLFVVVPLVLPVVGFLTYYLVSISVGMPLNTAQAFTSLAIFDVLYIPINLVPITAQFLAQMYVSMRRIEGLLLAEERQQGRTEDSPTAPPELGREAGKFSQLVPGANAVHEEEIGKVCVENAEVRWHPVAERAEDEDEDDDETTLTSLALERIRARRQRLQVGRGPDQLEDAMATVLPPTLSVPSLQIPKGLLTMVVGRVGSGKSTLLAALLNEAPLVHGSIQVIGSTSYCAQQAWLTHGTVRSNILFNKPMDWSKYIDVIKGCALSRDICSFDNKDFQVVGERGITLSGGQKARLALARTVYADKDIVLMDDVLSAVDAHVGTHLMNNVVLGNGGDKALLAGKTRVLVTHQTQWLPYADFVVAVSDGKVIGAGTYAELARQGLVDTAGEVENEQKLQDDDEPDVEAVLDRDREDANEDDEDEREEGRLSPKLWKIYVVTLGPRVTSIALVTFLLAELTSVLANVVLSNWSAAGSASNTSRSLSEVTFMQPISKMLYLEPAVDFARIAAPGILAEGSERLVGESFADSLASQHFGAYVAGYSLLLVASSFCIMLRNFIMRDASISSSRTLHHRAIWAVMRSPMEWHDTTPNGRKINRFTADLQQVDEELQFTLQDFVRCIAQLLTSILVIIVVAPLVLLILTCVAIVYYYLQRMYRSSGRELRRLSSMARSPVSQRLEEALSGKATINAKHETESFVKENLRRLDCLLGRNLIMQTAERWLALRLSALSCAITMSLGLYFLFHRTADAFHVSVLALSLKYSLSMTSLLDQMIQNFIFVELNLIALERLDTYANLPPEAPLVRDSTRNELPQIGWPTEGTLEFDSVVMRYRAELRPALRSCSFRLPGGTSVGIVGRTGAGKTSLLAAAFRLRELDEGRILIDNVDIATLGLHQLRGCLAIIPQDPVLFACPLRQNLDPWEEHSDEVLEERLRGMKLEELLANQDGLQMAIASDGGNLSVGQRQLLCLARALLRQTKIFFLDEATASIDKQTDEVIQETLRSDANSRKVTLVTIAHRLETILTADVILTMEDGRVAEFGPTASLANDPQSKFASFLSHAKLTGASLQAALQHGKKSSP